jgi:hypothetical protein
VADFFGLEIVLIAIIEMARTTDTSNAGSGGRMTQTGHLGLVTAMRPKLQGSAQSGHVWSSQQATSVCLGQRSESHSIRA